MTGNMRIEGLVVAVFLAVILADILYPPAAVSSSLKRAERPQVAALAGNAYCGP